MAGSVRGVPPPWWPVPWWLLLCPLAPPAGPCPFHCFCVGTPALLRCSPATLRGPPPALPPDAGNLTIVGGNLSVLHRAYFLPRPAPAPSPGGGALPLLRTLRLTHDNIQAVEEGAFLGLPALGRLDLSHNPLRSLAPGAFEGLPGLRCLRLSRALGRGGPGLAGQLDVALRPLGGLRRLGLAHNGLARLPPAALRLARLRRLDARGNAIPGLGTAELELLRARDAGDAGLPSGRVDLGANPLRCDCRARALLSWLRRAPWRVPDARALRCAAPRALQGAALLALPERRLRCAPEGGLEEEEQEEQEEQDHDDDDEELEASYVFFGLVLALIGAVFLLVLYLNRRGLQRWLGTVRAACRDQMEGYHYRHGQDGQPGRP
ncbi:trophoblast glycoprotein-like [Tachyglossus aculeatus]|uniref:trophoblast glycoprotein-like n=1 Tax=Tachyglossus aculeatus TaxID=9261 RepID=UPI0018F799AB|nr:trophoblast glycoprotein-like [Tachyglossus aculeatus]